MTELKPSSASVDMVSHVISHRADTGPWNIVHVNITQEVFNHNLRFSISDEWETDIVDISESAVAYYGGALISELKTSSGIDAVISFYDTACAIAYVCLSFGGLIRVVTIGHSRREADFAMKILHRWFTAPTRSRDKIVDIVFSTLCPSGVRSVRRKLEVPSWNDITMNYGVKTERHLAGLMCSKPTEGKVILFTGPPGTGKTYAIRALAWEWREICDFYYLIDPEVAFSHRPDYLVELVMGDYFDDKNRWKLLILEDAGELLGIDAKQLVGQGLSRLLNLTDGLIGQGLKVMVLITANEEIRRLHPAISRPGRAAAIVEFDKLSSDEANKWMNIHGVEGFADKSMSLAELYGMIHGFNTKNDVEVGFSQSRKKVLEAAKDGD